MREILFRGKDPETGIWYEGQYIHLHKTTYCFAEDYEQSPDNDIHQIVFERMTDWCLPNQHLRADVDPSTVGQYTGLTDKNGVRIFEGDILNMHGGCEQMDMREYDVVCKVVYGRKGYGSEIGFTGAFDSGMRTPLMFEGCLTVIGNIHDTPELLMEAHHD